MEGGSRGAGSGSEGSETSRKLGQGCSEVGGVELGAHPVLHKTSHTGVPSGPKAPGSER